MLKSLRMGLRNAWPAKEAQGVTLRFAPGRAFVLRIEPGQKAGQSRPFGLQSTPASRL